MLPSLALFPPDLAERYEIAGQLRADDVLRLVLTVLLDPVSHTQNRF